MFLRNELRRGRRWLASVRTAHPWIDERDLRMMRRAIRLARQAASAGEVPVGAVIYRGDEVVAEAANDREATADPSGHAEMVALRRAGVALGRWRLQDCRMAVTLDHGARVFAASSCHHHPEVVGGVREGEASALLKGFFEARR